MNYEQAEKQIREMREQAEQNREKLKRLQMEALRDLLYEQHRILKEQQELKAQQQHQQMNRIIVGSAKPPQPIYSSAPIPLSLPPVQKPTPQAFHLIQKQQIQQQIYRPAAMTPVPLPLPPPPPPPPISAPFSMPPSTPLSMPIQHQQPPPPQPAPQARPAHHPCPIYSNCNPPPPVISGNVGTPVVQRHAPVYGQPPSQPPPPPLPAGIVPAPQHPQPQMNPARYQQQQHQNQQLQQQQNGIQGQLHNNPNHHHHHGNSGPLQQQQQVYNYQAVNQGQLKQEVAKKGNGKLERSKSKKMINLMLQNNKPTPIMETKKQVTFDPNLQVISRRPTALQIIRGLPKWLLKKDENGVRHFTKIFF